MKRLALVLAFLLAALAPAKATVCASVPYSFSPGTLIQSGQVNANFASVVSCVNALPISGLLTNVVAYGADPTGATDSTAAINSAFTAAGSSTCVYFPTGTYAISNALTAASSSGCIIGDGRERSVLVVCSGTGCSFPFNLSALGALVLPSNSGVIGDLVRDISFSYSQPQQTARASIVAFPPAIYMENHARAVIQRVLFAATNQCIDATGNTGGSFFDTIECGALTTGLGLNGALDDIHVTNWKGWPYGLSGNLLNDVYEDGTNNCMSIGRADGLNVLAPSCYWGNVAYTSAASNSQDDHHWTGVVMDSGEWSQAGGPSQIHVTDFSWTGPAGISTFVVTGGTTAVQNYDIDGNASASQVQVQVSGGALILQDGQLECSNPAETCATVSGGTLRILGSVLPVGGFGFATTANWITQSSTGVLDFSNNRVTPGAPGGSYSGNDPLVVFGADVLGNTMMNNALAQWPITLPTASGGAGTQYKGQYVHDLGAIAISNLPACAVGYENATASLTNGNNSATWGGTVSTGGSYLRRTRCQYQGSSTYNWVYE